MDEVDPDQYCKRDPDQICDVDGEGNKIVVPAGVYYKYNINTGEYEPYMDTTYPEDDVLYEKVSMLDDDNNIVCIPMLEKLLTLNSRASDPLHSESLSGTIKVSIPNTKVIELDIYNKYKDYYPNITITYDDSKVEIEKAYVINFYPGATDQEYVESVGSIDGLTPGFTTRTATAVKTLAELIGDYVPIKIQTIANTFTFTGEWVDWADVNKTHYY